MLSMSDKYDSANERTREISESIKLHILWVWQMPMTLLGNWLILYYAIIAGSFAIKDGSTLSFHTT